MNRRRSSLAALGLFLLLAIVHTWPLASAPARLSRNDNADTMLNEWTLAWVAHQAPRHPFQLFQANIFYPHRNTLAYSEHLIAPAAMGAPLLWAGASPVLVYNLLLLAGFALTGWAGWRLVAQWTGDWWAGILTGTILAFNAHTLTRLPHLQALHQEFLPLSLLAFDAVLTRARTRDALLLAVWFVLESLTSFYSLVFTVVALVTSAIVRPAEWASPSRRRILFLLGLAAALAVLVVLPFLLPYRRVGQVRSLEEAAYFAASWRDYVSTPARIHYASWSRRLFGGTALFPGVVALGLTLVAVVKGLAFSDRRARTALAFGIAGVWLSFGPTLPGYAALYRLAPLLQGIRATSRFGYLAIAAAAILSGFSLAWLRAKWRDARWLTAATVGLVLLANLDAWVAPVGYVNANPISDVHNRLRLSSDAVVAELPFAPPESIFRNGQYLLDSTRHFRPMLNGYSGLLPDDYGGEYEDLKGFPDGRSIDALRRAGVTHVFVHYPALESVAGAGAVEAVRRLRDLQLIAADEEVGLYAVKTMGGSS